MQKGRPPARPPSPSLSCRPILHRVEHFLGVVAMHGHLGDDLGGQGGEAGGVRVVLEAVQKGQGLVEGDLLGQADPVEVGGGRRVQVVEQALTALVQPGRQRRLGGLGRRDGLKPGGRGGDCLKRWVWTGRR